MLLAIVWDYLVGTVSIKENKGKFIPKASALDSGRGL